MCVLLVTIIGFDFMPCIRSLRRVQFIHELYGERADVIY